MGIVVRVKENEDTKKEFTPKQLKLLENFESKFDLLLQSSEPDSRTYKDKSGNEFFAFFVQGEEEKATILSMTITSPTV